MRHAPPRFAPFARIAPCLAVACATALAPAADRAPSAADTDADRIAAPRLLWDSGGGLLALPLADVDVELTVTGVMAHGKLTQRFDNPTGEVIEAVYVFPMPDRAAVYRMEMRVGDRRIVAVVHEKEEARQDYDRAKQTGRKASLVDEHRPNLFSTSVANINPGETVRVTLEYYEEVDYRDGEFGLRFPLSFTPRYDPARGEEIAGVDDPFATGVGLPVVRLGVTLRPGFPLSEVASESHELTVSPDGDALRIEAAGPEPIADRDFLLSWRPEPSAAPRSIVFVESWGEQRFGLLIVLPPEPDGPVGAGLPTETIFVVDVSGSMAGPSIVQARQALDAALDRLRPEDRFNIIAFNDERTRFRPESVFAEPDERGDARRWVGGLRAGGGTRIEPALEAALVLAGEASRAHARRVVFLTDGAVANEQELLRAIADRPDDLRIHTVGIGSAPNAWLMRKMAELGRGHHCFVADTASAPDAIATFLERLDRPVMEDVELDFEGDPWTELAPGTVPDLYAGVPLVLSGKLADPARPARLRLGGHTRVGWLERDVPLGVDAPREAGIAYRWARARVESSIDSLHQGADPAMVRDEVVELALEFQLVTRYTSLLAVEDRPTALGVAQTARLAAALPAGGTDGPMKRRAGALLAALGIVTLVVCRREIFR